MTLRCKPWYGGLIYRQQVKASWRIIRQAVEARVKEREQLEALEHQRLVEAGIKPRD